MDESYPDARPEPIGHSGTNESVLSASVIPEITYIKARPPRSIFNSPSHYPNFHLDTPSLITELTWIERCEAACSTKERARFSLSN